MQAHERWARIRTLLEDVDGLPPAEREAYLARTCADAPDVRAEVESLLRAGANADGLLEPPDPIRFDEPVAPEPVLAPGTRLDGFEIVAPLGAGGMGRVYRARDTHLGRTVALKVLAPDLTGDADSQARFEREARILSQLNHPHICVLHDAGRASPDGHGEVRYLVMELVEGETLAARLARRPLPVDRAVEYATQIAEALEAAHQQGIVHRDLKPANVALTKAAGVKLLDFGLARLRAGTGVTNGAVVSSTLTQTGLVAGTLPYMSPEQVRGEDADARSDLFAFGAVLYEMLTGQRPFDAETPTALMVQILERDPPPLADRAPHVPVALDRLIRTCLAKDPADRWQHAHDVVLALRAIGASTSDSRSNVPSSAPVRSRRWLWPALAAGAVAAVVAVAAWDGRAPAPPVDAPRVMTTLTLPTGFVPVNVVGGSTPAISPDGRRVAIVGRWDGPPQVWIRPMASATVTAVPGTENAEVVFWAPDSQRIGFIARGSLRTVAVSGGPAQTLCEVPHAGMTGTWSRQGVILLGGGEQIYRVPERGGTPIPLVLGDGAADAGYWHPSFLPDGQHFLVVARGGDADGLGLGSLDGGEVVPLLQDAGAVRPQYAEGHILFNRRGELLALPFDVRTRAPTGPHRTLARIRPRYTVSAAGTVIGWATSDDLTIGFRMPDGTPSATLGPSGPYFQVTLSPSGARAAVVKGNAEEWRQEVWVVTLATSAWTRLDPRVGGSDEPANISCPVWGPDDRHLALCAPERVFIRDLSTGADQPLADLSTPHFADDWTADGGLVLFRSVDAARGVAVHAVSPGAPETQRVLSRPAQLTDQVQVSPDRQWVAYNTLDSDAWEVYVARFPSFTDVQKVSALRGGVQPIWASDGQRLFYLMLDGTMMAVDLRREGVALVPGTPRALFRTRLTNPSGGLSEYDVAKDGRFLIIEREPGPYTFTVLTNWTKGT